MKLVGLASDHNGVNIKQKIRNYLRNQGFNPVDIGPFNTNEKVDYVDYKDTDLLRKFVSDRAKIKARRVSGNDARQQRVIARAIKNAREMALIPYTSRVTTQRRDRRHDDSRQSSEESASSFVPEEENEEIEESYEEYLASDPEEQSDDKSELEVTE